jgi:uncharacterized protein (DUF433 family)
MTDESWRERITVIPGVYSGRPSIRGSRLGVDFILDLVAQGVTTEEMLDQYPRLEREDVEACLRYASAIFTLTGSHLAPRDLPSEDEIDEVIDSWFGPSPREFPKVEIRLL